MAASSCTNGSVVLASGVEARRLGSTLPWRSVAAGVEFVTEAPSSMAKAWAPVSSCNGMVLGREMVSVTVARSKPWMVPRLKANFWPLWSGGCEALTTCSPGASVSVSRTPVSGLACSL